MTPIFDQEKIRKAKNMNRDFMMYLIIFVPGISILKQQIFLLLFSSFLVFFFYFKVDIFLQARKSIPYFSFHYFLSIFLLSLMSLLRINYMNNDTVLTVFLIVISIIGVSNIIFIAPKMQKLCGNMEKDGKP